MANKICSTIQEEIAWKKILSQEEQSHVLSCADCGRIALEFTKLDAQVQSVMGSHVPEGFADRVMTKVYALNVRDSFSFIDLIEPYLAWRPVQIGLSAAGLLFAMGNIMRFVLFVFVSTQT